MIVGILLGLSLAVFFTSILFISLGSTEVLEALPITGAAIGKSPVVTYSYVFLFISIVLIIFFIRELRRHHKFVEEF